LNIFGEKINFLDKQCFDYFLCIHRELYFVKNGGRMFGNLVGENTFKSLTLSPGASCLQTLKKLSEK
jgi:hypothetical protein